MASSNPTELAKLLESVSVTDGGSAAQEALSNLFGFEIPLDAGVDEVAGFIATKLGLQSKNSLIQTSMFVLTKASLPILFCSVRSGLRAVILAGRSRS